MIRISITNGEKGMTRDLKSKAILYTDRNTVDEYILKSKIMNDSKNSRGEIEDLKEEIITLKSDISEIKEMITLLNKMATGNRPIFPTNHHR